MPKVSVILTSYNHAPYIREAIDSVLNQSYQDFELIIWDDASSDSSWNIIQQYTDTRIKSFRNNVNLGAIVVVNNAITMATGDYIAIHHSDDAWELTKLAKQVQFLEEHPEFAAVFTWAKIINENSEEIANDFFTQENVSRWQLLHQLFIGDNRLNHPSVLIKKHCYQTVGLYRYGLAQTADAEMWSRVLLQFPIHIMQEKLTKHRLFTNQANSSGYRLDVKVRINNEWNILRENFLSLNSTNDIIDIFPELEHYRTENDFDSKFLLAMACLNCKQRNAWQLGLRWLFELLHNDEYAEKIKTLYQFSELDLIKLTGRFDVYHLESLAVSELETEIENLRTANTWLTEQNVAWEKTSLTQENIIKELQAHIENLQQGNAWLDSQRTAWETLATERNDVINRLTMTIEQQQQTIQDGKAMILERDAMILERDTMILERDTMIQAIYNSSSWKMTQPLRFVTKTLHNKK